VWIFEVRVRVGDTVKVRFAVAGLSYRDPAPFMLEAFAAVASSTEGQFDTLVSLIPCLNLLLLSTVAMYSIVFVWGFFLCAHDNSWTAALSLMEFCMNMWLDNGSKPREFQVLGHRTGFSVFLPLRDRAKKFVEMITHELLAVLHLAWWNLAWACTLTTSRTYWISRSLVKGQGHMRF